MFKKIFSAAKNLLRNPVAQVGIGLLLPGLAGVQSAGTLGNIARGIGGFAAANPMLTQAGLGLAAGDKPENVLRNVAYGSLARGIGAMGTPEGFMGGVQRGFGMTPAGATEPIIKDVAKVYDPLAGSSGAVRDSVTQTVIENAKKPGFLERFGLIKSGDDLGFFEKYSPLLKLGAVGATIASAAMSEDEKELFYDPTKNPYLKSGSADKDFFENINPYYSMNQGGVASFAKGGMDNLRKSGMVYGPGGPKDDLIDAKLSNGEFVFTAAAVDNAGGPRAMYKLMNSLDPESEKPGEARGIESV